MKHWTTWLVIIVVLACTPLASAERILLGKFGAFASNPFTGAILDLGLRDETTVAVRQDDFLDELRSRQFELVIVRSIDLFQPALEDAILAELEAHLARGGKLHFQMAELDQASDRYLDLLGLAAVVELELPLVWLDTIEPPRHPSMPFGGLSLNDQVYPPDFGDTLIHSPGSRAIIRYQGAGDCTVISHGGRILVNGHQWDNWAAGPGGGQTVVRDQIRWFLRCPADLDLDGVTTINDFLVFQNLFAADDPSVDFDEDGALTIFDFLEFLNQFEDGC